MPTIGPKRVFAGALSELVVLLSIAMLPRRLADLVGIDTRPRRAARYHAGGGLSIAAK
jgi:hypothetical protein